MITFNFYTLEERTPKHGEEIIFLSKRYSFDSVAFDPILTTVEYVWDEEIDGEYTGTSVCYTEGEDMNDPNLRLRIIFDGYYAEDCYWCPVDEYTKSLPEI